MVPAVEPRVALAYAACCVLWGSTWSVAAVGLRDLPPLLLVGLRSLLAGALLTPFARRGPPLRPADARRLAGYGLLQLAVPYALMFVAQQWTPSGLAAVLFASFPVWVALLGRAVLGEPLTPARAAAAALGVAGVAVLQAPAMTRASVSGPAAAAGLLIVAASVTCAFANVRLKQHAGAWAPVQLTWIQTLTSGALLLAASLALEHGRSASFTPRAVGALVYLAVFGTVVTYLSLYWLLPRVPMAVVATIPLLDTAVAVTLGAVALGEPLGWHLALGAPLVLGAAALAGRPPAAESATAAATSPSAAACRGPSGSPSAAHESAAPASGMTAVQTPASAAETRAAPRYQR